MTAKKKATKKATTRAKTLPFVVVRARLGVFAGELVSHKGSDVVLRDARRIWYWTGANTCSEISLHGVAEKSCITEPVAEHRIAEVGEVLIATAKAAENLRRSRWNR